VFNTDSILSENHKKPKFYNLENHTGEKQRLMVLINYLLKILGGESSSDPNNL
jgi:hypothetical protein